VIRGTLAVAGASVVLVAVGHAAVRPFPHFAAGSGCARADFPSAGVTVRAERCGRVSGRRAVVVLHGCGGFNTFDHQLAADLPRFGVSTLYVDYFAPTPPPGTRGFCSEWGHPQDLFQSWERVAADAAASLHSHFSSVGAVGWSLGAGVAISAGEDLHAFKAIAAFSALAHDQVLARAGSLPPTIFLDGGRRDIVRPENARLLYAAAHRANVPARLFIYGNGTHGWPGKQGEVGRMQAARFLLRYLR
jgi:dienelactone hydrolase